MTYPYSKEAARKMYHPHDNYKNRAWMIHYDSVKKSKIYGPRLGLNRKYSDEIIYGNDKVSLDYMKGPGYGKSYVNVYDNVRNVYIRNGEYTTVHGEIGKRIIKCVDAKKDPVPLVTQYIHYKVQNWIKPNILYQKQMKEYQEWVKEEQTKFAQKNKLINGKYNGYQSKRYVNIYLLYIYSYLYIIIY